MQNMRPTSNHVIQGLSLSLSCIAPPTSINIIPMISNGQYIMITPPLLPPVQNDYPVPSQVLDLMEFLLQQFEGSS